MSESLIPTHIINPVTPSIPVVSNSVLNTSMESAPKECDVTIVGSSSVVDISMKDDTANYQNTQSKHANENDDAAHHAVVTPDHTKEKQLI